MLVPWRGSSDRGLEQASKPLSPINLPSQSSQALVSWTYLQAAVHGRLGRVHNEVAQGETKTILKILTQQQCPRPLPGEGAPRRAPISRAQWRLQEQRDR